MKEGDAIEVLTPDTFLLKVAGIRPGSTGVIRQVVHNRSLHVDILAYVQFDQHVKNGLHRKNASEGLCISIDRIKELEDENLISSV